MKLKTYKTQKGIKYWIKRSGANGNPSNFSSLIATGYGENDRYMCWKSSCKAISVNEQIERMKEMIEFQYEMEKI